MTGSNVTPSHILQRGISPGSYALNEEALPAAVKAHVEVLERSSRNTKIVATLGPASSTEEQITQLIRAGVNVFRLNFSHGTHEEHAARIALIKKLSRELGSPAGILQDLSGPKLRIGKLSSEELVIPDNSEVRLRCVESCDTPGALEIPVPIPGFTDMVKPGDKVFLADGRVKLVVTKIEGGEVIASTARGSKIRTRVGIAFPDTDLRLPAFTDKDLKDLEFGLKQGVDFVALSFVQGAEDIRRVREEMKKLGRAVPIVAKIERKVALDNLPEIVQEADLVMVARGDLGVDIPLEEVPDEQVRIILEAHRYGKPVIIATQMLLSMTEAETPTRSEMSDIVWAARDGADALMLSEETAIGKHPALCVQAMARAAKRGELSFDYKAHEERVSGGRRYDCSDKEVLAISAAEASVGKSINAIIVLDQDAEMCPLLAKHRPHVPVYAYSSKDEALAKMTFSWGVHPHRAPFQVSLQDMLERPALDYFAKNPEEKTFGALVLRPNLISGEGYTLQLERIGRASIL